MVLMGGSICRVFVALLALSLFTYARAASQTSAPAGSPTAITIGVVADNAPYSNADGADITGFSIDIHKEITRNTGLHFDYRAGSWAQIYQAFLRGEIDAIDAISYREDRARSMLFTEPYHVRQTVIMHDIKKPIGQLTSLQDLHNKKIGILNDIYYKQVLADAGLGIVEYDAFSSLIQALAFGWPF